MRLAIFFSALLAISPFCNTDAQDTVTVQCFTFSDITKRRDKFFFPTKGQDFRRVIMEYTLKCDPATTADQYPCGEWDYLSYTYVHDKRGIIDSTRRTQLSYVIAGTTPDSFPYTSIPVNEYRRTRQPRTTRLSTSSLNVATVSDPDTGDVTLIAAGNNMARAQFIYTAAELRSAGLTPGDITGLRFKITAGGSTSRHFTVRMKHFGSDTFAVHHLEDSLQMCYSHQTNFLSSGIHDVQFQQAFTWNGISNILVDIAYEATVGTGVMALTDTMAPRMGMFTDDNDFYLYFGPGPRQVNLGKGPVSTGNTARTVEMWARADAFNNGGLFRMGTSGTGKDFSLRTTTTPEKFRVQHWGAADFDVVVPGSLGAWRHFALVYNGAQSQLYVDGQLVATKNAALSTPSSDFILGRWEGNYFTGAINDVRVWNTALSQQTIAAWMHRSPTAAHPYYSDLRAHYPLDEGAGVWVGDASGKQSKKGYLDGTPHWTKVYSSQATLGANIVDFRPILSFEQGVYSSRTDTLFVTDTLTAPAVQIVRYQNPAGEYQIPDNAPNHPSIPTDTILSWEANRFYYTYNSEDNAAVDSHWVSAQQVFKKNTLAWYSPYARFEIGRFITPYGINLQLGQDPSKGFTWYYDVTDYYPLLQDTVDISSGNNQELHDLKFHFITGKPSVEVLGVKRIWGQSGSYSFKNLAENVALPAQTLPLHSQTKYAKVKTRLTGHGHNSNDGNYPHCCEWRDNTHSLSVNGQTPLEWHIWRANACAENPVQPQGGTWPGAREGWCPGDVVPDFDFDISDKLSGSSVTLDYNISPVPTNNLGMGNGNYVVAMHLIQYGAARYKTDAEVYDVISPNNTEYYSKRGVVCREPIVVFRNAGEQTLTAVKIKYGTAGGDRAVYQWRGSLAFGQTAEVTLPLKDAWIFSGSGDLKFEVSLYDPNGTKDDNDENNSMWTSFTAPDRYDNKLIIEMRTNNRPEENKLVISNERKQTVHSISPTSVDANRTWRDTLDLAPGCYVLELSDAGNDGLQYWANSAAGSGAFKIWVLDQNNNLTGIKNFKSDFGRNITYSFTAKKGIGGFVNPNPGKDTIDNPATMVQYDNFTRAGFYIYPNPSEGDIVWRYVGAATDAYFTVTDMAGNRLYFEQVLLTGDDKKQLALGHLSNGIYTVTLTDNKGVLMRQRWVKSR